jgi:hypothetical protein
MIAAKNVVVIETKNPAAIEARRGITVQNLP